MLRKDLCEIIRKIKINNNYTYDKLITLTSVQRSQWIKILNQDGDGVSLERLEKYYRKTRSQSGD